LSDRENMANLLTYLLKIHDSIFLKLSWLKQQPRPDTGVQYWIVPMHHGVIQRSYDVLCEVHFTFYYIDENGLRSYIVQFVVVLLHSR